MEHIIEYSSEELKKTLERNLDELNVFRYNNDYRDALGPVFMNKLTQWEEDIAHCKESPFTLAVIGDFKRGKSTFINALLGEEVVATDVTTETVTLNRISYGLSSNEAVLSGNRRVRLSDSELRREKLESLISELGEPIERLEIKRPCEILKKITILDTPGTGDAMQDFSDVVKESLLQADAVIYVYNVQYPLSKSEQMFLKAAVLPQKYTSLFMVGNFSDVLETKESYDRMEEMLKQRVSSLLPNVEPYMISALDELCLKIGEETEETELTPVLRERFSNLRKDLDDLVDSRADNVVVDRIQRLAMTMVRELESILDAQEEGLHISISDAEAILKDAESSRNNSIQDTSELIESLGQVIKNMKVETNAWMGEFIQRIVEETKKLDKMSNDDLKRYYEFYCVDLLQEALNTCVEYHIESLFDIIDSVAEGISSTAVDKLKVKKTYNFRMDLDNRIWTKGDTVGLVTSFVSSANYLTYVASLVADGISGSMREKEKENRVPELIEQISRKLLNMSAKVSDTVNELYDDLGEKAKQLLVDYYEEQMEQTRQLMEQTAQTASKSVEEKEKIKEVLLKAREVLEKIKEVL